MRRRLRLIWVFALAGLWLLLLLPVQLIAHGLLKLGWRAPVTVVPVIFHRGLLKIMGVRLRRTGPLDARRPLLIVSNHVSWLDIVVLSALRPLSFVAKADMRDWPFFGLLARLQRTVFVRREERRSAGQQADMIAERMAAREVMVLFPEGTTSDGNVLLPFKTPLFEAAKRAIIRAQVGGAVVQPCAIDYSQLHGLSIGRAERPHIAWPGEIGLEESLINVVATGALDVTVHIGASIELSEQSNRKIIASEAAAALREMLR
ncbi:MAG: lysophospholipid acyltransferase family protein [Ahrensia sp.]|nr:lysophospholipid acyltransferase family protein [Ahrensia sp.]